MYLPITVKVLKKVHFITEFDHVPLYYKEG